MKSNYRKTFVHTSLFLFSVTFIFCLTSCLNLFSKNNEEQQITVVGRINLDSSYGSDFLSSDTNENRSAAPKALNINGTTYEYYIKATRTKNEDGSNDGSTTRETNTVDSTDKTFTLDLLPGTWTIEVSVQKVSDSATILYCKQTGIELSADDPIFNLDFYLTPVISDGAETPSYYEGSINLSMTVPSSVSYAKFKFRNKPSYVPDSDSTDSGRINASSGTILFSKNNVKCGTYDLLFTFYNSDDTPLFSTSQTINVLRSLITDRWVGTTSALIKADGTFELTDNLIKTWRQRRVEYYVGGTDYKHDPALDYNTGGPLDPIETLKHAIALVNDIDYGDTTVKIHMADGTHESVAASITINNGKKVAIDALGTTDRPSLERAANFVSTSTKAAHLIKVGTTQGSTAELTISDIIIDGKFRKDCTRSVTENWSDYKGVSDPESNFDETRRNTANPPNVSGDLAGAALILNYGNLIIQSGFLQNNCDNAIYNYKGKVVMNGGSIQHNVTYWQLTNHPAGAPAYANRLSSDSSAVHTLGDFIMNGGKIFNNEGFYGSAISQTYSGSVILNGGEITDNYSRYPPSSYYWTGAIETESAVTIGGPVTISNNYYGHPESNYSDKTISNLCIVDGKPVNINGNLTKGTDNANVWVTTRTKPTASIGGSVPTLVSITSGYNSSVNKEVHPGTYFHSDEGYAVVASKNMSEYYNDAELALSGGGLSGKYSENIEFTFTGPDTIWAGSSVKQTVTVKKNGTEIEEPTLTLEFLNSYGSDFTSDTYRTFSGNELTLLDSLPEGKYTAGVSLVDNGIKYTGTKTFTVVEKEKSISSGSFDYSMASDLSNVFKSGRTSVANIKPLIVSTHEVTQKEYETYCLYGNNTSKPNDTDGKSDNHPVYGVNWYEAIIYCNLKTLNDTNFGDTPEKRRSHCAYYLAGPDGSEVTNGRDISKWPRIAGVIKTGISWPVYYYAWDDNSTKLDYIGPSDTDGGIRFDENADGWRLPTEAEWEYLARGGNLTTTGQTTYSGRSTCGDVAWYSENSGDKTHEVCTKAPNGLGLYDMSGNVWEWCWDWYDTTNTPSISITTPATGVVGSTSRVYRGGCWVNNASNCTVSDQNRSSPAHRSNYIGFRVVRTAE